jgi:hypothetical protein
MRQLQRFPFDENQGDVSTLAEASGAESLARVKQFVRVQLAP